MDHRQENGQYRELAEALIATEPLLDGVRRSSVRIAYLSSDYAKTSKRRPVYAECEKVPDRFRWSVPYDFAVTVFEPNCEHLDGDQMAVLMLHELLHVGVERDGNEETSHVVPHDVEDFKAIIDRHGLEWSL